MQAALQKFAWEVATTIGIYGLIMSPVALLVWRIRADRRRHVGGREEPFNRYPTRPPGESLRLKIEELQSQCDDRLTTFLLIPSVFAAMLVANPALQSFPWLAASFVIILTCSLRVGWRLKRLGRDLRDHRLGYLGERVVGEQLNQLMLDGFRVFHDVPFDGFNIDHVIVGAPGVFAVETKTRRKPRDDDGTKQYRVSYDGTKLRWPWGDDDHGLNQARDNARALAAFLSSATGERTEAEPMLVVPGWFVVRTGRGKVTVLNEHEVRNSFRTERRLSSEQIQRIAHQLTEKCRLAREQPTTGKRSWSPKSPYPKNRKARRFFAGSAR